MRRLLIALLLCTGCTFEWNGDEPGLPLVGPVPELSSYTKLNAAAVGRATLMLGPDGVSWTAFCEFWAMGSGNNGRSCQRMHLSRLGAPNEAPVDEILDGDSFGVHLQTLYRIKENNAAKNRTVTLHRPGDDPVKDVDFVLGGDRASFVINDGGEADVFLYWIQDPASTEWTTQRHDQRYVRHLPIPAGVDPSGKNDDGLAILLTADGGQVIVRTPDGTTTASSTLDETKIALGNQQADLFIDDPRARLISFGDKGIAAVPLDGSAPTILTSDAVDRTSVAGSLTMLYFATAAGLWQAPLDLSAPPTLIQPGALRARALGPHGEVVYSYDSANEYTGSSGDGWLGDWKFMERGRQVRFSADGARIHFLEHAATLSTYGDLTVATDPQTPPRLLSINAHVWDELDDGRVVAIENAIQAGSWNRLIVIDEQAGERHWLVPGAAEFFLVPGKREMIVDVISGASGYDILRVPAPE